MNQNIRELVHTLKEIAMLQNQFTKALDDLYKHVLKIGGKDAKKVDKR